MYIIESSWSPRSWTSFNALFAGHLAWMAPCCCGRCVSPDLSLESFHFGWENTWDRYVSNNIKYIYIYTYIFCMYISIYIYILTIIILALGLSRISLLKSYREAVLVEKVQFRHHYNFEYLNDFIVLGPCAWKKDDIFVCNKVWYLYAIILSKGHTLLRYCCYWGSFQIDGFYWELVSAFLELFRAW